MTITTFVDLNVLGKQNLDTLSFVYYSWIDHRIGLQYNVNNRVLEDFQSCFIINSSTLVTEYRITLLFLLISSLLKFSNMVEYVSDFSWRCKSFILDHTVKVDKQSCYGVEKRFWNRLEVQFTSSTHCLAASNRKTGKQVYSLFCMKFNPLNSKCCMFWTQRVV